MLLADWNTVDGRADEAMFEWVVESEQIDLDRWSRAVLRRERASSAAVTRWGMWPVPAVLLVVFLVALAEFGSGAIVAFVPLAAVLATVFFLVATAPSRMAKKLRSVPAASEAFTFVAGPLGTHWTSASGSDHLRWDLYTAATTDQELILLVLDGGAVRVLPVVSLRSSRPPADVVATISGWIEASRPDPLRSVS